MKLINLLLGIGALSSNLLAQSVSYTSNIYGVSDELKQMSIQGFDPSLGNLTSVVVNYSAELRFREAFEHTGTVSNNTDQSISVITWSHVASYGLVNPLVTNIAQLENDSDYQNSLNEPSVWNQTSSFIHSSNELATGSLFPLSPGETHSYDGTFDFSGTSGYDFSKRQVSSISQTSTLTSIDYLNFFTNSSSVNLYAGGSAASVVDGPGNLLSLILTESDHEITVTYNYQAVPETSSVSLIAIGALGSLLRRKRN